MLGLVGRVFIIITILTIWENVYTMLILSFGGGCGALSLRWSGPGCARRKLRNYLSAVARMSTVVGVVVAVVVVGVQVVVVVITFVVSEGGCFGVGMGLPTFTGGRAWKLGIDQLNIRLPGPKLVLGKMVQSWNPSGGCPKRPGCHVVKTDWEAVG